MEIVKVEIENFKSIGSKIRFDIENNFLCLLGKNNMGKTNILDAIEFMSNYSTKKYKDYCNFDNDGKPININLHFINGSDEIEEIFFTDIQNNNNFYELLCSELINILGIIENNNGITVHKNFKNILTKLEKNRNNDTLAMPRYRGYNNDPTYKCKEEIQEIIINYIEYFLFNFLSKNKHINENTSEINRIKFSLSLDKENISTVILEVIEDTPYEDFLNFIREDFKFFYEKEFEWNVDEIFDISPIKDKIFDDILNILMYYISLNSESIFSLKKYNKKTKLVFKNINISAFFKINKWRYSDNYIIPNSLPIYEFIQKKGDNCIPLLNLLNGAKITLNDFNDIINDHQKSARILGKLNKFSNDYLTSIWPDFKEQNLEFEFKINSDELITNIRNIGLFNHRSIISESDGVKQFLSIILSQDLDQKSNKIYLIDEPEIHLHPSSVIAIRKYIEGMSEKVSIIVTTHSMHMIDINSLPNYAIVEKDDNHYTTISNVDGARNISELLMQSFGIDIFSDLMRPDYYMLVEGSIDEQIIKKIIEDSDLNCMVIPIGGTIHLNSYIKKYKKILSDSFFNNNFFIFLDSDATGIKSKEELINSKIINKKNIFLSSEFIENSVLNFIEDIYNDEEVDKMKNEYHLLETKEQKRKYKTNLLKKNIDILPENKCIYFKDKLIEKIRGRKDV